MLATEMINGAMRLVDTIDYKNGKRVKRIINIHTGLPEDSIVVRAARPIAKAIMHMRSVNARYATR